MTAESDYDAQQLYLRQRQPDFTAKHDNTGMRSEEKKFCSSLNLILPHTESLLWHGASFVAGMMYRHNYSKALCHFLTSFHHYPFGLVTLQPCCRYLETLFHHYPFGLMTLQPCCRYLETLFHHYPFDLMTLQPCCRYLEGPLEFDAPCCAYFEKYNEPSVYRK